MTTETKDRLWLAAAVVACIAIDSALVYGVVQAVRSLIR